MPQSASSRDSLLSPPRRILILRPSALGDVCRSVPVLAGLRRAFPDAAIDWLVQSDFVAAIATHPDLHEAVAFPRKELAGAWKSPAVARRAIRWLGELRRREYDLVMDFQGLGRSGLMTWATRAARRVGFRDARELAWLGYNVRHSPPPPGAHTVDRMLALLEAEGVEPVGDMRLYVSDADRLWWRQRLRDHLREQQPREHLPRYAVLAPTARWPSKRWPIERWRELIEPLLARGFESIVLIGAPGEEPQVAPLAASSEKRDRFVFSVVGKCTIGQTMAAIGSAGVLIANDSAPLHMAVGLGTPCLGLFGPTDPAIVGPYLKPLSALRLFRPKPGEIINYRDPKLEDRLMRVISTAAVIHQLDRVLAHEGNQSQAGANQSQAGAGQSQTGAERQRLRQQTQAPPRVEPPQPSIPDTPTLYLASASPRRRLLLSEMGIEAATLPPDIDDGRLAPGLAPPADRVLGLAYLKARRVADQLHTKKIKRGIVLGADTLCVHDGRALGQPRDADHARQMLQSLRSDTHRTMTGVCLINLADDRRILFHDEALVRLGDISDDQIEQYVASGEWRGKAGGYNLNERIAAGWAIECDGDPSTVMGLPVKRLRALLDRGPFARSPSREPERAAP